MTPLRKKSKATPKQPYVINTETDLAGRWHVWIESLDPKDLATIDDLYREARSIVPEYATREWTESAALMKPGEFHLKEKAFGHSVGADL
jgi:hypothetical protein